MRFINVLLSIAMVVVMFVLALEGGLRLLGKGPGKKINQPDAAIGWVKRPDFEVRRRTPEFDAVLETNSAGLRDDELASPAKPEGSFRVLVLGDSFTLGYTVARQDLFVDQLERWWDAEGRAIDVINAGTEGYSTDQEVAWYLEHGKEYEADLVLLVPYENDIFWNGQLEYLGTPKPRFTAEGELEADHIQHDTSWRSTTAIGRTISGSPKPLVVDGVLADFTPLLDPAPAEVQDAMERTRGALARLKGACQESGARLVMAPIPSHHSLDGDHLSKLAPSVGLDGRNLSPSAPMEFFMAAAAELGIAALDCRAALGAEMGGDEPLYYERDFHLTPRGNEVFTGFLHSALDAADDSWLPAAASAVTSLPAPTGAAPEAPAPFWPKLYGVLVVLLGTAYAATYKGEENPALAFVKVALLLAAIFTIAIGGSTLLQSLPPQVGQLALLGFIALVIGFIVYKLGRRTGTILELFGAFVGRGHWYLMPLVVVLLTVGSLLVVAASSPLVAPFIYTLF